MALLRLAYVIALRRVISGWRLEAVLLLGMVLAVSLMSGGVIFSDLLAEAALGHALDRASPEEANFIIRTFSGQEVPPTAPARVSAYQDGLDFVEQRVASRFRPYLRDHLLLLESPTFFFEGHPRLELTDDVRPRGDIQYMSGMMPERVQVVQGIWPYSGAGGAPAPLGGPLEVAIDDMGAELLQLGVGDEMRVFPAASYAGPPRTKVKIVGIFRRVDPQDEFWYAAGREFSFQSQRWTYVPLFTAEDAILRDVLSQYPMLYIDVSWTFFLDRQRVRAKEVEQVQSMVRGARADVLTGLRNSSMSIKLDRVLDDYEEQLLLARIPLFMILFLVTGILAYYLGLVSGLVVKLRNTEIAMLKSRGATTFQIGLLSLVEGLVLAVAAVALGPPLALAVVRLLGRVFFGLGGSGELAAVPVALSPLAFLLGLASGLLAVVALTVLTLAAARHGMVEFRQAGARPPRVPFVHRYYLDIMALVLIGVVWWQTQSRESFLVRTLGSQELQIDYSLLLGPALGLLTIGLLVMRAFPMLAGLAARAAEPLGPPWLVHGLRHVARDPMVPGSLIVLLTLATALGVIGSAFSSTLERSQQDRALYAAGADLRIRHTGAARSQPLLDPAELARGVEQVAAAANARRDGGYLLTRGFGATGVSVLEVDADRFGEVAWYRPDFAGGKSLAQLLTSISPAPSPGPPAGDGIPLPRDTRGLALWAQPSRPDPRLSVLARLKDAEGQYFDMLLGDLGYRGWQRLEAGIVPLPVSRPSLGSPEPPVPTPPFTLLSLHVSTRFGVSEPGALFLWRLAALTPGEVVIADFKELDGWHAVEDYSRPGLFALEPSELAPPVGAGSSAVFSWSGGSAGMRGVRAGPPEDPIPAVVSGSLLEAAEARVGDTLNLGLSTYALPIKAVAVADYFPTLDPQEEPFAVVDLKTFIHSSNLHSSRLLAGPDELWVGLRDPAGDFGGVVEALDGVGIGVRETLVASEMVSEGVEQPLTNAGWGGLLVLVFLVLALASASGVMLFSYVDTRDRSTEFALLRTLGSSTKQLNAVVWFSVILVVAIGIGVGSWSGYQVGASLLPLMEVAEEGSRVTPPMVLQTNGLALLVSYLVLAGVTAGTVLWLGWLTHRMEVQQVLRAGPG